jgi:hypothetical protein
MEYEKKVSWLVVKKTTGEAVCREESLQAALVTVDAVEGLDVKLEVVIRIRKPINEMGKEVDIRA